MKTRQPTRRYFRVRNFETFQHYKDRSPPWIKLYADVLGDYEMSCLQDASKLHLVFIWVLASRNNNRLPYDPEWIGQRIQATEKVDLDALQVLGFIEVEQVASDALAEREQSACLETETETETEESSYELSCSTGKVNADSEFDRWWANYPKKVKKVEARKAWTARSLGKRVDELIDDVAHRRANDRRWLDGFVPDPTTYLRGERWNDEITPVTTGPPATAAPRAPTEGQRIAQVLQQSRARRATEHKEPASEPVTIEHADTSRHH